ncbi:hypothetical protein AZO1586I_445 [Bathymodiolus thermophilus thioautotrophic gill symbiont]|uniref:Uncharacterized protein n=2 Tax=sulfur-oxidizing symbionts TaxID=32036 RepID=A0ACA8ZND5_9GAMM|nr:hypothetical protein AZO1586R_470 [Bathymodiolus azoricus thioautotrophic gill symbiont]CAB5499172.1 hypothetical protein AZO1586I_445 [Bathymodiolus thermophilus thioautotrophic gill symbiont]CAC5851558.1 hypothetical protein [uncultured Gammaproteobacteria bacterium]VVH55535.1 hypothetical protein BAZOLSSOX_530 [uncultured Gammaproteobacteria bacterium]
MDFLVLFLDLGYLKILKILKACNCIFARFSQTCTTTPNYQS